MVLTTTLLANEQVHGGWLTGQLIELVRGGAEWVLWLLLAMLVATIVIFVERLFYLRKLRVDSDALRAKLSDKMRAGDVDGLLVALEDEESMEARVLTYALREADRGPEAVLELAGGAIGSERLRYERRLSFLATVGSNAPFIGLFGTVIGVILAFDQLQDSTSTGGANTAIMGVIAEALIATGVGLLVAIPAIIFFNLLKLRVNASVTQTRLLAQTAAAYLRRANEER